MRPIATKVWRVGAVARRRAGALLCGLLLCGSLQQAPANAGTGNKSPDPLRSFPQEDYFDFKQKVKEPGLERAASGLATLPRSMPAAAGPTKRAPQPDHLLPLEMVQLGIDVSRQTTSTLPAYWSSLVGNHYTFIDVHKPTSIFSSLNLWLGFGAAVFGDVRGVFASAQVQPMRPGRLPAYVGLRLGAGRYSEEDVITGSREQRASLMGALAFGLQFQVAERWGVRTELAYLAAASGSAGSPGLGTSLLLGVTVTLD